MRPPRGWPADWPHVAAVHEALHVVTAVVTGVPVLAVTAGGPTGDGLTETWLAVGREPNDLYAAAAATAAGEYLSQRIGLPPECGRHDRDAIQGYRSQYMRLTGRLMPDPFGPVREQFACPKFHAAGIAVARELARRRTISGTEAEAIARKHLHPEAIPTPGATDGGGDAGFDPLPAGCVDEEDAYAGQ